MNIAKKLKRTIVFLLKVTLFAVLFAIFFGVFGIHNPWLFEPSRTTAVTMITFVVLGISLMAVYGGYSIGAQKSKPIIHSMVLVVIITDLVTHLQLSIMKRNDPAKEFIYETPHLLLLVIVLHILVIIIFTYLGNHIYFMIEPPEKCCVIASSEEDLGYIIPKILRFKKQYEITNIIKIDNTKRFDIINGCDTVFLYEVPSREKVEIIEYCFEQNINVYYDFEMYDIVSVNSKCVTLDDKSLAAHTIRDLTFEQRVVKRLTDIFVSVLALVITSPIMLVCAVLIKLEDGGKVLYKQARMTKYGRVFQVYKFRSMKEENSINKSVTANDDRITKVGKFLRKFRIDELPQFINILSGEMSVVGPRPEMLENVVKYTDSLPEFSYRLRAKAGLTGLAQINGKYNTSPKDKLVMDLMYIENFSIWQDLKIIFQTVTVLLKASESTEAFSQELIYKFDDDESDNETANVSTGGEGIGEVRNNQNTIIENNKRKIEDTDDAGETEMAGTDETE